LEALDTKLGVGCGATKERSKLQVIVDAWEEQEQRTLDEAEPEPEKNMEYEMAELQVAAGDGDSVKLVPKHGPDDRVAILGGDPARRREAVERKLAPFGSLRQFGSPNDVGYSDTIKLLNRIEKRQYDVVYVWKRFNSHASRLQVKEACLRTGTTRFEEVETLGYIL
jgi:hypothetical protein